MKLEHLFERSISSVSKKDIERFGKLQSQDDINSDDIRPEKYKEIINKISKNIRGGKIKIYRAIELEPHKPLQDGLNRRLGTSWTYDLNSAKVYRSQHRGYGDQYILEATIDEKYIDWDTTIALNTIKTRGTFENEIRLFKSTPIMLDNVYMKVGSKLVKEDIKGLKGSFRS